MWKEFTLFTHLQDTQSTILGVVKSGLFKFSVKFSFYSLCKRSYEKGSMFWENKIIDFYY